MAYINRPKKSREIRPKEDKVKLIYDTVYNTGRWRKLREGMLMSNPLCQSCGKELSTEVHHIRPLSTAKYEEELLFIGFDPSNLICLCSSCHNEIHRQYKRNQIEDYSEFVEKIKRDIN